MQLTGENIPNWISRQLPPHIIMEGKHCLIEVLDISKHAKNLFSAYTEDNQENADVDRTLQPFQAHRIGAFR